MGPQQGGLRSTFPVGLGCHPVYGAQIVIMWVHLHDFVNLCVYHPKALLHKLELTFFLRAS